MQPNAKLNSHQRSTPGNPQHNLQHNRRQPFNQNVILNNRGLQKTSLPNHSRATLGDSGDRVSLIPSGYGSSQKITIASNTTKSLTESYFPGESETSQLLPSPVHHCCRLLAYPWVFFVIVFIIISFVSVILFAGGTHKVAYSVPTFPSIASLCKSFHSTSKDRPPPSSSNSYMSIQNSSILQHSIYLVLRDSNQSPDLLVSGLPSLAKLTSTTSSLSTHDLHETHDDHASTKIQNSELFHKCSHYSCFDIYRCGTPNFNTDQFPKHLKRNTRELIKVYVYPNHRFVNQTTNEPYRLPFSSEFSRMLASIVTSPYYTSNPWEACLLVVNLDLLNTNLVNLPTVEQILWSLPHFNSGFNHLLFSMVLPPKNMYSHFNINIGNAMVAGGGYNLHRYRSQFDVSIPVYSVFSQLYENEQLQLTGFNIATLAALPRKWKLICTQTNLITLENRYYLKRLESLYSKEMLLLYWDCEPFNDRNSQSHISDLFVNHNSTIGHRYNQTLSCSQDRKITTRYLDALHSAEFCLILNSNPLDTPLLSDSLMSGCIPVIMSDTLVLPFEERIDWASVVIRVWEHSTNEVMDILNKVSPERIRKLRLSGLHVWRQYFSSVENITRTTLDIINERVFPRPRRIFSYSMNHFAELAPLTLDFYSNGYNYITPKQVFLQTTGFTTVILSYNRVESLFEVLMSVARTPSCAKIIVVWNNQNMKPPPQSQWPQVSIPLQVIVTESNKLSNRFYPYPSIETEAIFAIDDDIAMLNADEIEFAFQTWREFPDRIVGFPSRLHFWDNATAKWYYNSEWKNGVSLVLTGAAFYHNYYNFLYTFVMHSSIRDWVDEQMNCEDIAMNFLISNVTRVAPIKVTPRKKFKTTEFGPGRSRVSVEAMNHLMYRSRCIDHFASIYKMMPLKAVEFRSNPVLYLDNIPEKLKKFNLIGSL